MQNYEKLGAFYLGRVFDPETREPTNELLLYDAKDLTTHAVCVGMTGSGKTGLCLSLLEEALIDNIPVIAIDPKGDLGNLLLTFPDLGADDFAPWVDEGEATRKGMTKAEFAEWTAKLWRKGLGDWGQDGERIRRLKAAGDIAIYTPGSQAGLPITVLRSLAAPTPELVEDSEAFHERIESATSGLLGLLGIDADPLRSKEHILLSNLLMRAWGEGRDLSLADLIREIQAPPMKKVGVFDLDSFFPESDRFALAMRINNLLASPGFSSWMEGQPLDIKKLLWTDDGRPRIAILSIAHLSDAQRMFFVTLVLNEIVSWMRAQSGTTSLRALLYMDEVFGYLPPVQDPASKKPMMTILKQARAFGVGCVLATQNPVDLDYKALSNAGTWFLGRLQTERDKARVLDGLEGASATAGLAFDRGKIEAILSGLQSRVFLMNNVREDGPVLFHSRWAMSYLRGPLTRGQIQTLMASRKEEAAAQRPVTKPPKALADGEARSGRPVLPSGIEEAFLPVTDRVGRDEALLYRPSLIGDARLHFASASAKVDIWREVTLLVPLDEDTVEAPWEEAPPLEDGPLDLEREADSDAGYDELPMEATKTTSYSRWGKQLKEHLYRSNTLSLWKCSDLGLTSEAGETEGDFRARLGQAAREARDLAIERLRKRYGPKLAGMEDRIRRAEQRVEREEAQAGQQKMQTAISLGATILGALFGRKKASVGNVGRAATTLRGAGRAMRERQDVELARENVASLRQDLANLEQEFENDTAKLQADYDPAGLKLTEKSIRPRKSDISVGGIKLVWVPWRVPSSGRPQPAYR